MTDPSLDDQMAEALAHQRDHIIAAHHVDRRGWSRGEWVADARRLMDDLDGSARALLNGHVTALLSELAELQARQPAPVTRDDLIDELYWWLPADHGVLVTALLTRYTITRKRGTDTANRSR